MKRGLSNCPWIIVGLVFTLVVVAGCNRVSQEGDEAPEIEMTVSLDPDPPLFGRPCRLTVTVVEEDGAAVEGAQLEIKGDMTHAGMVPVVVTVVDGEGGRYATDFEWTMAGDWVLTIEAQLADGRVARREFEVRVGIPGG